MQVQVVVTHRISDVLKWPGNVHPARAYSIVGGRVRVSASMVVEGNKHGAIQGSSAQPVSAIIG